MAAVAQLNPPAYRKPSDLNYVLHGWLNVYKSGDLKRGYEVFDEREIEYGGHAMGSWTITPGY